MASFTEELDLPGSNPDRCFRHAHDCLEEEGFTIWKTRPLAWFLIANKEEAGSPIEVNLGCRPGAKVILTLKSPSLSEAELSTLAGKLISAIQQSIGNPE